MIDLDKRVQVSDQFFLPYVPVPAPAPSVDAAAAVSSPPELGLETELARLRSRGPTNSASSSCSSSTHTSLSGGSGSSRSKFHHYHEPTILDRPEAVDAAKAALVAQDRDGLARVARQYGLPPLLRAEAWPLLLRGHPYVLAQRATTPTTQVPDEDLPLRHMRGDVRRLCQTHCVSALHETTVFAALLAFLRTWGARIPYEKPMAWIALFLALGDYDEDTDGESAVEFTGIKTEKLASVFTDVILAFTHDPAPFSNFISELRTSLPELSEHFATEGILSGNLGGDGWLVWWLKWYGIRMLPSNVMTRMWDTYFAMAADATPGLARAHVFNCLVVMKEHRAKLLELDQSECRQLLAAVPACNDVEAVMTEARLLEQASHLACQQAQQTSQLPRPPT